MTRSRLAAGIIALPAGAALTLTMGQRSALLLRGNTSVGGDPAAAIAGLAALAVTLIAAWLMLCLGLALLAELPGATGAAARRLQEQITPALVQRWAAIALGASATATLLPGTAVASARSAHLPADDLPGPGWAPTGDAPRDAAIGSPGWGGLAASTTEPSPTPQPTHLPDPGWTSAPSSSQQQAPSVRIPTAPHPGWLPSRPVTKQRTEPHLLTGRQRATAHEHQVVVRRGDTLWSLAAANLGHEATDAEIAQAWPRWHDANRSVIGSDPHHLLPGTILTPPPTD